jgi:signal transduction histidine kinase
VFVQRENDRTLRQLLDDLGFNYSFPLWYETHLLGLLLVDSYPRLHLDEDEAVLLGLSRQISQSIQTHHLVEAKINLERALLEQAHLAKLGEHSRSTAHEIKNSLTGMKTLAQVMRADPELPEERATDLDHLVGEIARLDKLAQQLLVYGRPLSRERSDVSLAQIFESARQALPLDCANWQIRIDLPSDCDLVLQNADRESLHQIVLNLILNAIQVSAPGDTVRLSGAVEPGGGVCMKVSDEGPGIPAEIRDRIFEPFFTTKPGGTGLGLAIVKKNVRELGGWVRVDSPTSGARGATFTVTIPINVVSRKTVVQSVS